MSFVAVAIIGAGAIGAGASIFASSQQQKSQQAAIQAQQQTQQQALNIQGRSQQAAIQALLQGQQQGMGALQQYLGPYANWGTQFQGELESLLKPGPNQTAMLSQLPGFQFQEDLAKWGIEAGAGKTGISGSTAVEGGTLASQIASQNWGQLVSQLMGAYGQGQGAATALGQGTSNILTGTQGNIASTLSSTGQNMASTLTGTGGNIASLLSAQGQTQAGGITGAAGAIAGPLTNLALLKALTGGSGMYGSGYDQSDYNMVATQKY